LRKVGDIAQPVAVAKSLLAHGVSLRKAHEIVNRLTADEAPRIGIPVSLSKVADVATLTSDLVALGIEGALLRKPEEAGTVLPRLRDRLRLTQDEFALLIDVELGTLRNWEQGRTNVSGGPLGIIVNMLMHHPEALVLGRTVLTEKTARTITAP
jgi:putative transcriptional regulator